MYPLWNTNWQYFYSQSTGHEFNVSRRSSPSIFVYNERTTQPLHAEHTSTHLHYLVCSLPLPTTNSERAKTSSAPTNRSQPRLFIRNNRCSEPIRRQQPLPLSRAYVRDIKQTTSL